MAPRPSFRWTSGSRATVAAVTLCLLAVLGLDATTIAAAPGSAGSAATGKLASMSPPAGLRLIQWSGRTWLVYPNAQPGPEPGVKMTDSPQSVYVDSRGRLHLKIRKINGVWRSVELRALAPVNYGTYQWVVRGSTAKFSRNTVLGLFVYRPGSALYTNEIDIEDSRFSNQISPNNAQYVVQPYLSRNPAHWCTYHTPRSLRLSTQRFTWTPGKATFETLHGTHGSPLSFRCRRPSFANSQTRDSFTYAGPDVPSPDNEHIYINLWTDRNRPPTGGTHSIVLDSFHFTQMRR